MSTGPRVNQLIQWRLLRAITHINDSFEVDTQAGWQLHCQFGQLFLAIREPLLSLLFLNFWQVELYT